jgi:hypothetical protein
MGVVSGEFGRVELYAERKTAMQAWLEDPRDRVRTFAEGYIRDLDRRIDEEQRFVEASIAIRKLDYGEELDGEAGE